MDSLAGFPAILISGGTKFRNYEYFEYENEYDYVATESRVEVISPTGEVSCTIPDMPEGRSGHSMDFMGAFYNPFVYICGGSDASTQNSCIKTTRYGWEESHRLQRDTWLHTSWAVGTVLILFGGYHSPQTSETVYRDGTSVKFVSSFSKM